MRMSCAKQRQSKSRASAMFDFFLKFVFFLSFNFTISILVASHRNDFRLLFFFLVFARVWLLHLAYVSFLKCAPTTSTMANFGSNSLALHTLTLLIWLLLFVFSPFALRAPLHLSSALRFRYLLSVVSTIGDRLSLRMFRQTRSAHNHHFNCEMFHSVSLYGWANASAQPFAQKPNTDDDVVRYVMLMANQDSFDDYYFSWNEAEKK